MKLNIQAKRQYFMSMQSKTIDNDKKFWKTVKHLFYYKNPMSEKVTLIEDGRILSNDVEVAECFNEYFCNIPDSLDIDPLFKEVPEHMSVEQIVLRALTRYKDHPSIKVINQNVALNGNTFSFSHVSPNEVMKKIDLLDKNKSNIGNIPTSFLASHSFSIIRCGYHTLPGYHFIKLTKFYWPHPSFIGHAPFRRHTPS